ncbi:hypothetical protein MSAN_00154900 [Mycena sanguinolenta]|uniref:CxC2-like cysteine cluster KDZ transposase-associated domain-containing protein n=1 Tax=Mycena sanguinolenta TaxID=230812 RepID=A0A8H6ZGZ0_9AGAR|nr:hypothetical protein MSAN_00154900 [Mycena sanguinolenta]
MSLKRKQAPKKPTVRHFAPRVVGSDPVAAPTIFAEQSTSTRSTARILLEKTRIRHVDGHVSHSRSVIDVSAVAGERVHADLPKERAPIYDWFGGGDVDMDEDLEGPRSPRDSDDPLRQWVEDHRTDYLAESLRLEGRGDHCYSTCRLCYSGQAEYRCRECLGGGELMCRTCVLAGHARLPFHQIEYWLGMTFERISLKDLGLRIQLGHWHDINRACPLPECAIADDFVIIDIHGVHQVALDYCGCGQGGHPTQQLLRAQLWPATTTNPKTAATFAVLRLYHLLSFEAKCSALEFYQSLARQTDNLGLNRRKCSQVRASMGKEPSEREESEEEGKIEKERYQGFLRITRQWRHIRMLKRAGRGHDPLGIANTKPGECALLCPACPHPGKNLPANWKNVPDHKTFLYALFLALDANFRLKRKDVSSEAKDPGLGNGWAFFCEVKAYMKHVRDNWNQKQERSHCVAHDAVDKPDREARGTASSGIAAVDCARHNMKRPNAIGDLQLGERYLNMDYMFFISIAGTDLNEVITIDGEGKFMTFLIPKFHLPAHIELCNLKFSFHLTPDVGQTDGEAPERGWADANPLARSTKEMGPGARRDTLDDHFNDWNHKKIIRLGHALRKKTEEAVPAMVKTKEVLRDLEESLGPDVVETWTTMAEEWEKDETKPNPFETLRKDAHVAKVRAELAEEAAAREKAGTENLSFIKGDMHITELLAMGLQLEDQQRVLASDISSTGLHPTDGQRRAMTERTSKLRRKIFAWIAIQTSFFPTLQNIRQSEDDERARLAESQAVPGINVTDIKLWLPSAIAAASPTIVRDVPVPPAVQQHEYRLRVGQAHEALHELRRLLLVRTHLYKLKDTHSRGVRANMRSHDKIAALNNQIQRAAAQYRVARAAVVTLAPILNCTGWQRTLKELKAEDGEEYNPADGKAMNEVRIEWAKTRARCHRWREEVDLLEEEMARVLRYCEWRSNWWMQQQGQRSVDNAQLEGETAYAVRQAAVQRQLARGFTREWAHLSLLIEKGRSGELELEMDDDGESVQKAKEDSDEEAESDDEEEQAIPSLPHRPTKPAYVDELTITSPAYLSACRSSAYPPYASASTLTPLSRPCPRKFGTSILTLKFALCLLPRPCLAPSRTYSGWCLTLPSKFPSPAYPSRRASPFTSIRPHVHIDPQTRPTSLLRPCPPIFRSVPHLAVDDHLASVSIGAPYLRLPPICQHLDVDPSDASVSPNSFHVSPPAPAHGSLPRQPIHSDDHRTVHLPPSVG